MTSGNGALSAASKSPRGADDSRQFHTPWLITFGDLLTLLLCFFLSALGMSHDAQTKQKQLVKLPEMVQVPAPEQVQLLGTPLANHMTSGLEGAAAQKAVLVLTEEHLADPSYGEAGRWLAQWEGREALQIGIKVCSSAQNPLPIERARGLRQLVSRVRKSRRTEVEVEFGITCEQLGRASSYTGSRQVAVVLQVSSL